MATPPRSPQKFSPDLEVIGPDEGATDQELTKTMLSISRKVYEDSHHAVRSVHAKSHGLLKVRIDVLPDLPEVLAQGVFANPRSFDGILRLSTIPGDILPDRVSTPRGAALRFLGVEGDRLPGSEEETVQDFIMVNAKQFNSPDAKTFLKNLKLLASTTDRIEHTKEVLSGALRTAEKLIEKTGKQSALLKTMGGEPETDILGESFFTQLALRYGTYIAKLALVPVSANLLSRKGKELPIGEDDNAIRTAVRQFFESQSGEWELRVQLCSDIHTMPTEDATVQWDETVSPFIAVARITAAPQPAWNQALSAAIDDGMGFSPWRGLAAHQPLGSIMRMRRHAYARAQQFRSERNYTPVRSPTGISAVPN